MKFIELKWHYGCPMFNEIILTITMHEANTFIRVLLLIIPCNFFKFIWNWVFWTNDTWVILTFELHLISFNNDYKDKGQQNQANSQKPIECFHKPSIIIIIAKILPVNVIWCLSCDNTRVVFKNAFSFYFLALFLPNMRAAFHDEESAPGTIPIIRFKYHVNCMYGPKSNIGIPNHW